MTWCRAQHTDGCHNVTEKMGLAWTAFMAEQWEALPQLRVMADNIKDPNLKIPDYYYAPIHAYKDGMIHDISHALFVSTITSI